MGILNLFKLPGRPKAIESEETIMSGDSMMISIPVPGSGGLAMKITLRSPDDLLLRKGYQVYREMRQDDQAKVSLWFKKILIAGRAWEIRAGADTERGKDVAKFCQDALKDIEFNAVIMEMLTAFDFGVSYGEINWITKDIDGERKIVLKDIKFRDPEYFDVITDIHGNIVSFLQKPTVRLNAEIPVHPSKVLHYAYQSEFQNHLGISDLRAAYRAWWSKKFVTQFFNVFLERFGSPLMMAKYPKGASEKLKSDLKNILNNLSSKSEIMVPEGVNIELVEAARSGTAKFDDALAMYDVGIAKAILTPAFIGFGSDVKRGSDSQSRIHLRTTFKMAQFVGNQIAHRIQKKILEPMAKMNFTGTDDELKPSFEFQDYGEFESFEITDSIKEMFNAGILDLDQDDINYARSILGLPLRDEEHEDEILRSPPPPVGGGPVDPNAAGLGATQGNNRAEKGASSRKTDPRTDRPRT